MEESLVVDLVKLVAVALLVLTNGFFVAAEFSLVSVRRTRIAELVELGNQPARWVQRAIANPDNVIAATQLGITLSSLGLGWIGEPALSHLILPVVELFPLEIQSEVSHTISAALAFAVITFMHVVVGELMPKSIALQDPEKTSLAVAQPTVWTEILFKPFILALNGTGNALLRLIGVRASAGHHLLHSVEELKMIVTASAEGGAVDMDDSDMLHAIFDLSTLNARRVMVPRTEIIGVEANASLQTMIALSTEYPLTKFPVYEGDLDRIMGVVHVRDIIRAMLDPARSDCTARSLNREVLFVPESISANALLREFRIRSQHMAIVLDEFGGTAGLVTLQDLLEEIVGEVSDPFNTSLPGVQAMPDGSILIDGMTLIEDVNDELGLKLSDPDYDTIAGYLLGKLGRIPKVNDSVDGDGVNLKVVAMDGLRVERLSLTFQDKRLDSQQPGTATA